jgi:chitinase
MTLGYYPDWSVWTFPVSQLDWSKLDVVDFAFAIPNADFALEFTQYNSIETLQQLVAAGHSAGKRVRLSIGGWTGSVYFSAAVSSESNRMTFANNIASVYNQYSLDGIDIDWEYPGVLGSGSNGVSSSDTANFLLFLNTLRATLPSDAFISAATQVWPFADENGSPSTDVSGFAKVLDWITVMNYDIWGSSDTPGPNAPLSDACGTSTQPLANAYAAVASWTTAGMPADQIMLGIAAYGYLQNSSANKLRTRRRHLQARDTVTIYNPNGGTDNGQVNFASLISQGALVRDDSGIWVGAGGFTREWDSCSSTPWLKSWATGQVVTYDDPQSISLKAQFARQAGLRGTSVWEITGDMGPSDWSILSAARSGLGI